MASAPAWLRRAVGACWPDDAQRDASGSPRDARRSQVAAFPMLRHKADFDALARNGTARSNRLLVLRTLRTAHPDTRVGMSTPRSLGGAVQRNRVRRRLRELVRERHGEIGSGWDLLLIARPEAALASHAELRAALGSLLERSGIGR